MVALQRLSPGARLGAVPSFRSLESAHAGREDCAAREACDGRGATTALVHAARLSRRVDTSSICGHGVQLDHAFARAPSRNVEEPRELCRRSGRSASSAWLGCPYIASVRSVRRYCRTSAVDASPNPVACSGIATMPWKRNGCGGGASRATRRAGAATADLILEADARPAIARLREDAEHAAQALTRARPRPCSPSSSLTLNARRCGKCIGRLNGGMNPRTGASIRRSRTLRLSAASSKQLVAAERRQESMEHRMRRDFVSVLVDAAHLLGAMLRRKAVERHAADYAERRDRAARPSTREQHVRPLLVGIGGPALHPEGVAIAFRRVVIEGDGEFHFWSQRPFRRCRGRAPARQLRARVAR